MNRILDANINRSCEGIRVIEDILRFKYEDLKKVDKLRNFRHTIRKLISKKNLIDSRNSKDDIGKEISFENINDKKKSLNDIIDANFSRIQESLRVLEEILKKDNYKLGKKIESIRFEIYQLEKNIKKNKRVDFRKEIYGITNNYLTDRSHIDMVKLFLKNNIRIIQYRDKSKSKKQKLKDCLEIRKIIPNDNKHLFIVNDDVDIAHISKADGVHLGQDDLDEKLVKVNYPDLIIGKSTHNKSQVKRALNNNVDYIGVGPIFKTNTKKDVEKSKGTEFLKWVSKNIDIPYVCIGGINNKNIKKVFENKGLTVAMISQLKSQIKIDEIRRKI
ncbi:MAG: thiamine phosphate synthase [Bacillota bacterium]